jgi:hypothetical protein
MSDTSMTGQGQDTHQEPQSGGVVDLIVAELRKHELLLNQLNFPGTLLLHLNPNSKTCPIIIQIEYKLPGVA